MQNNRYEREFSNFIHDFLPSSSEGMWVTDIDYVLYNKATRKFCMIELKTRGNVMKEWQKEVYGEIHKRLKHTNSKSSMQFVGTYCVEFDGENFDDGRVWIYGSGIKKTEVYSMGLAEYLISVLT